MTVGQVLEEPVTQMVVSGVRLADESLLDSEIEPEDRADYHWDVPSVAARLEAGEAVFMSDFEQELCGWLATARWPQSRPAVAVARQVHRPRDHRPKGRRLAVEADGSHHHETPGGELIPEDLDRQALLEEAGWTFHRVAHRDYLNNPKASVQGIIDRLAAQPPNPNLAARVWAPVLAIDDLIDSTVNLGTGSTSVVMVEQAMSGDLTVSDDRAPADEPDVESTAALQERVVEIPSSDPRSPPLTHHHREDPTLASATGATKAPDEAADLPGPDEIDTASEGVAPSMPAPAPASEQSAAPPYFEDIPLGEVAMLIAAVVSELGAVSENCLPDALRRTRRMDVPAAHERSVRRFAWTAKGKHWIDLVDGEWVSDTGVAERDERYGHWTFKAIVERARRLLVSDPDPFEQLLAEVYAGARVPKLPMSLVGSAINRAKRTR